MSRYEWSVLVFFVSLFVLGLGGQVFLLFAPVAPVVPIVSHLSEPRPCDEPLVEEGPERPDEHPNRSSFRDE